MIASTYDNDAVVKRKLAEFADFRVDRKTRPNRKALRHYAWRLSRLWWLLRYGRPGGSDTRHGLTTATGGRHGQG